MKTEGPAAESFRLLINRGDLEGLIEWMRMSKPLREPSGSRKRDISALELAVERGFFSMVKVLLAEAVWSDDELERALDSVVWNRREDLAALLIDKGASLDRICFYSVFRTMNDALIDRFLDMGLDPCKDNAFAKILGEAKSKSLLRFFKEKRVRFPALEMQMAMALIQAIQKKNVRWCALLIWAGADLNKEAPYDLSDDPTDEDCYRTTPLEEALNSGDLKFIEALKIKTSPDMMGKLIRSAAWAPEKGEVQKLIKRASPEELNSGENGSCAALEDLVSHRVFDFGFGAYKKPNEEEETIKAIDSLLKAGAKWIPSEEKIRSTRRSLFDHDAKYIVRVVRMLLYTPEAAAFPHIWELCRTPTMRSKIIEGDHRLWDELDAMAPTPTVKKTTNSGSHRRKRCSEAAS